MQALVDTYACEWTDAVEDPGKRAAFRHFANDRRGDDTDPLRSPSAGRRSPARRPQARRTRSRRSAACRSSGGSGCASRRWPTCRDDGGIAVRCGAAADRRLPASRRGGEWYATQNSVPHKREMVLARGIVGDQGGRAQGRVPAAQEDVRSAHRRVPLGRPARDRDVPGARRRRRRLRRAAARWSTALAACSDTTLAPSTRWRNDRRRQTHCPYCAFQCGLSVTANGRGNGAGGASRTRRFRSTAGRCASRGYTSAAAPRSPGRLVAPLLRGADGVLAPVSWDAALDFVAERLLAIRERARRARAGARSAAAR